MPRHLTLLSQKHIRCPSDRQQEGKQHDPLHTLQYLDCKSPLIYQPAMPKIYVDIAFGRGTTNPVMYSLPLDKSNKSMHENNLFVAISDRAPRRLVGDGWKADPVSGEVNGGWLYHGVLKGYPRSRNFPHSLSDMQVAVKWVRGQRAIESLRREARMYDDVLRPLQGTVVPTFYGFFAGRKDGIDVGCMLLEWCPGNDPATSGKPTEEVM